MKLINLQRYTPDELFNGGGIQYFKDESGKDWFKSLPKFTRKFSLAIENDTGVIRSISEDASRLYPVGLTVVDIDTLPEGCDISGAWRWSGGKIYAVAPDYVALAAQNKTTLLAEANQAISTLSDAIDLDIATDEEKRLFNEWRKYRVLLSRVETTKVRGITWPEVPQ
ncbi:MAG: tail fiber assembly protein [Ewingella sp.]|uniref:tail fiber assembly protein n=1 Tax=Ewingella TaxID=41201 RepID=UPI0033656334